MRVDTPGIFGELTLRLDSALLQCVQVQRLDHVHERDLSTLYDWLWYRDDGGLGFLNDDRKGTAPDTSTKDLYEERKDLISLRDRPGFKDDFTELLTGRILKFLNDKVLFKLRVSFLLHTNFAYTQLMTLSLRVTHHMMIAHFSKLQTLSSPWFLLC